MLDKRDTQTVLIEIKGKPFALDFRVDGEPAREVRRSTTTGPRGESIMTVDLVDNTQIVASEVLADNLPFERTGKVRIDARDRVIGETRYDVDPFEIHIWQPHLLPPPAPGKNHTMPGELRPSKPQPAKKSG